MPLRKQIGEMFVEIGQVKGNTKAAKKKRAEMLKAFDASGGPGGLLTLRVVLKQALDPRITYALPKDPPPYKPLVVPVGYGHTDLYHETKRLHYFLEPSCGGHAGLKPAKREQLFITTLEGLQHLDAEVLIAVKDKDLTRWGIDADVVNEAIPELLAAPVMTKPIAGL